MRALGFFFVAGFRRYAGYRLATAAGAFTNTVFGLVKASILVAAISGAGGSVQGYTALQASTYAWFTQAFVAPVYVFNWNLLALRVRTGDVAVDLCRPVDPQLAWLAEDLGRAAYALLPRALPPLVVGALTFGLIVPRSPVTYALAAVSLTLAVVISFACRWIVNLVAFWLLDVRGVVSMYVVLSNLLCGLVIPVPWFPGWLRTLAQATPFPSMLQAPVDVVTGRVSGSAALATIAVQLGWATALLAAGRVVLARGSRKLVIQGG